MSHFRSAVLFVALAVILSGCGVFEKKKQLPCPRVVPLKDAQRLVKFAPGGGTDLSAMLYEIRVARIAPKCTYRRDEVEVDLALTIHARRGPADTARKAPGQYFVAIMDPRNRIVAKRRFDVTVSFPVNVNSGSFTDSLVQKIPIAKGRSAAGYVIVVGLQLTAEELRANRSKPGTNLPGRLRDVPIAPATAPPSQGEPEYPPTVRGSAPRVPGENY